MIIQSALTIMQTFYFGQANDFFLKHPAFNREGDLLVELQYQGV